MDNGGPCLWLWLLLNASIGQMRPSEIKRVTWVGWEKGAVLGETIVSIDKDLRVAFMRKLWPGPANWMSNACFVIATIHQLLAANLAIDIKNTRAMAINT